MRKSVKKIASIRNEVNEIERRISKDEVVELMIKEPKERLRVNETLMALLFKLDSVRGVDSGVRDLRKAVIKKAIALQEMVDGFVSSDYQTLDTANNDSAVTEIEDSADCLIDSENALDRTVESQGKTVESLDLGSDIVSEQTIEAVAVENEPCHDEIMPNPEKVEMKEDVPQSEVNAEEENCAVKEIDQNCEIVKDVSECLEENAETSYTEDCGEEYSADPRGLIGEGKGNCIEKVEEGMEVMKNEVEERDDNKRNRELLEKMIEDNEKMMRMMTQIFERNEQQTRMLNSLSHRVEQLEKAFICDKLRRKKNKRG